MLERFNDAAGRVFSRARDATLALHYEDIGAGHILLGILEPGPDEDGTTALTLSRAGVDHSTVHELLSRTGGPRVPKPVDRVPHFDQGAKDVLERSRQEADDRHSYYIGPELLLFGLIAQAETGTGPVAELLTECGVPLSTLKPKVTAMLLGQRG